MDPSSTAVQGGSSRELHVICGVGAGVLWISIHRRSCRQPHCPASAQPEPARTTQTARIFDLSPPQVCEPAEPTIAKGVLVDVKGLEKRPAQPPATESEPSFHEPAPAFLEPCPGFHEPAPAFLKPCPAFLEPSPGFHEPAPAFLKPCPAFLEPSPGFHEPAPAFLKPCPAFLEPSPGFHEPAPAFLKPCPAFLEPSSGFHEPFPASHESAPASHESAPAAHESAPAAHESAPEAHEPAPAAYEPTPACFPDPAFHEPVPAFHEPTPAFLKPSPAFLEPSPGFHKPFPASHESAPASHESAPAAHESTPASISVIQSSPFSPSIPSPLSSVVPSRACRDPSPPGHEEPEVPPPASDDLELSPSNALTPALLPPLTLEVTISLMTTPDHGTSAPPGSDIARLRCRPTDHPLLSAPPPLPLQLASPYFKLCLHPRSLQHVFRPPDPLLDLRRSSPSLHHLSTSTTQWAPSSPSLTAVLPMAVNNYLPWLLPPSTPPWNTILAVAWHNILQPLFKAIHQTSPPPAPPWTPLFCLLPARLLNFLLHRHLHPLFIFPSLYGRGHNVTCT
ncbi:uncharacterized protein [Chanodichthys erythropterus]|uniref:uncharacterized protein n=1 Tax=Chanodichthys erythropterus TaxID=933992 RepID=UPI00351DB37B